MIEKRIQEIIFKELCRNLPEEEKSRMRFWDFHYCHRQSQKDRHTGDPEGVQFLVPHGENQTPPQSRNARQRIDYRNRATSPRCSWEEPQVEISS